VVNMIAFILFYVHIYVVNSFLLYDI